MDNEVTITLVFHAMGDDPIEAATRCLQFITEPSMASVLPQEMRISVEPR